MAGTIVNNPVVQFFDNNGNPLAGGKITTYLSNTVTPAATYQDEALGVLNTNPIILNSRGEATIWLTPDIQYTFVLTDADDNLIQTVNDIYGAFQAGSNSIDAGQVSYTPAGTGAVSTTVDYQLEIRKTVADFGVVGDGVTNDTAAFLVAKAYFDSLGRPMRVPAGFKIILDTPLVFDLPYTGIVFEEGATPYSFQNNQVGDQWISFVNGSIPDGSVAITLDSVGLVLANFSLGYGPDNEGCGIRMSCYSSRISDMRIKGFKIGVVQCRSSATLTEAIFNTLERVDMYPGQYGLVLGRDENLAITTGAVNECTYINTRFRGLTHCIWAYRDAVPESYNQVFINCIIQETPPLGIPADFFDMLKIEGGQFAGMTFIGGRFESSTAVDRKTPRINVDGADPTRPLVFFMGTYIQGSVSILDTNNYITNLGNVAFPDPYSRDYRVFRNFFVNNVAFFADGTAAAPSISNEGDGNTGIYFPGADIIAESTAGVEHRRTTAQGFFKASNTGAYNNATGTYHEFYSTATTTVLNIESASTNAAVATCLTSLPLGASGNHYRGFTGGVEQVRIANNGNVTNVNNSYGLLSDAKLKENIKDAPSFLDKYMRLRFVTYNLKEDLGYAPDKQLGWIAQEVEQIFPSLVVEQPDLQNVVKTREVEKPAVFDKDGNEIEPAKIVQEEYIEAVPTGTFTKSLKASIISVIQGKVLQEVNVKVDAQQAQIEGILARLTALESK